MLKQTLKPGIHDGISMADYCADPAPEPSLSSSIACELINYSPRHAWLKHPRLNPAYEATEDSRFDLGSAAHAALLESDQSQVIWIAADDWRTKIAKEARDIARSVGRIPVLEKHRPVIDGMVKAAREYLAGSALSNILHRGKPEQTGIWTDGDRFYRMRMDWWSEDLRTILDYKSCFNAQPDVFARQISRMGYDVQAAFYLQGIQAIQCGEKMVNYGARFIFLAQEIEPPYACSLHELSNGAIEIADAKVDRAMQMWDQCMAADIWPAYGNDINIVTPSEWEMRQHEQRMIQGYAEEGAEAGDGWVQL